MAACRYYIHDIIHINTTELYKPSQGFIYSVLKGARGFDQPKGHNLEFKQTKFASKSRHILVGWLNLNLMVTHLQIQTRIHIAPQQAVQ